MNIRAITICALMAILLLVACGKTETTTTTPQDKTSTTPPKTTEPTVAPPGELVREVAYEEIFKLQYCNYTLANLDYDSNEAKDDIEDAEKALAKNQEDFTGETDDTARRALQSNIDEYKAEIADAQKRMTAAQADFTDTLRKCNTLEKKKDGSICKEFYADAQRLVADAQVNLVEEEEDLNEAITNNVQSKIIMNQRKVAIAKATLEKMQRIQNELQQRCG